MLSEKQGFKGALLVKLHVKFIMTNFRLNPLTTLAVTAIRYHRSTVFILAKMFIHLRI